MVPNKKIASKRSLGF